MVDITDLPQEILVKIMAEHMNAAVENRIEYASFKAFHVFHSFRAAFVTAFYSPSCPLSLNGLKGEDSDSDQEDPDFDGENRLQWIRNRETVWYMRGVRGKIANLWSEGREKALDRI